MGIMVDSLLWVMQDLYHQPQDLQSCKTLEDSNVGDLINRVRCWDKQYYNSKKEAPK